MPYPRAHFPCIQAALPCYRRIIPCSDQQGIFRQGVQLIRLFGQTWPESRLTLLKFPADSLFCSEMNSRSRRVDLGCVGFGYARGALRREPASPMERLARKPDAGPPVRARQENGMPEWRPLPVPRRERSPGDAVSFLRHGRAPRAALPSSKGGLAPPARTTARSKCRPRRRSHFSPPYRFHLRADSLRGGYVSPDGKEFLILRGRRLCARVALPAGLLQLVDGAMNP